MTTKPHSNGELEFNRLCTVLIEHGGFKRGNGTMDSYEQALWLRTLLAQKDAEVADARREERERIITIVKENTMAFMFPSTQERFIETINPPDQTTNPTN